MRDDLDYIAYKTTKAKHFHSNYEAISADPRKEVGRARGRAIHHLSRIRRAKQVTPVESVG